MKKVLIIRLTAMGDVAMTSPVVSAACRRYPDIEFHVLSEPFFEPFFDESLPNLHFIGTNIRKSGEGVRGLWKLYRKLAVYDFDIVLDLHDVLRTKILRTFLHRLSRIPTFVVDKGRGEKNALVRSENKQKHQLRRTIDRYADVFSKAGLSVDVTPEYREKIASEQADLLISGKTTIGVSPFAQHKGKVYPIEKMKQVVSILAKRGVQVLIFGGGAKEKAVAEQWESEIEGCRSVIGKIKLRDEMALMSRLDCMISMDSSAMHICSLFGVRVVSVWGATHPYAGFLGFGQREEDAIGLDMPCRPCSVYGNKPCQFEDYRCFNIAPETIADKVMSGIADKKS